MKSILDMIEEERQEYIEKKAFDNTYRKINDKLKQVLKELKGYE